MALLEVGHVVKPHGLAGEVVVTLVTNRLERLDVGSRLHVRTPGPGVPSELEVIASRPHLGRFLVFFAGIARLEEAESLRGAVLEAEPIADPDALFVHELIGSEVLDTTGRSFGHVTAIEANPASDLLVVEGRSYVPLRFVVDRSPGRVVVEVPDGLLE